jgi:hypothetical protein
MNIRQFNVTLLVFSYELRRQAYPPNIIIDEATAVTLQYQVMASLSAWRPSRLR